MPELPDEAARPATRPGQSIGDLLDARAPELAHELVQALRATMFDHRPEVRPALFGRVAAAEVQTLLAFLRGESLAVADERGVQLCRSGFGEEGVLGLGQALRRFTIASVPEPQKTTSSGFAPTSRATCSRASSTAAAAA